MGHPGLHLEKDGVNPMKVIIWDGETLHLADADIEEDRAPDGTITATFDRPLIQATRDEAFLEQRFALFCEDVRDLDAINAAVVVPTREEGFGFLAGHTAFVARAGADSFREATEADRVWLDQHPWWIRRGRAVRDQLQGEIRHAREIPAAEWAPQLHLILPDGPERRHQTFLSAMLGKHLDSVVAVQADPVGERMILKAMLKPEAAEAVQADFAAQFDSGADGAFEYTSPWLTIK